MTGRRNEKVRCAGLLKDGTDCRSAPSKGWTRCPFHTWQAAQAFEVKLAEGADMPPEPERHELLALGLFVHNARTQKGSH